jgi:hypothetical protein
MTSLEPMPGKPATRSATMWGAITTLIALVVHVVLARLHVAPADIQAAIQDVTDIVGAVGSLVAIYGRWKATTPITSITAQKES